MKEKVLKNYNTELNMLLLVNILLFIMLGFGLDYMADKSNIIKLLVMIVVPGIPSLLVTNFISVDLKEDLILDKKYEEEPILTLLKKEDKNNEIDFHLIELEYGKYSEDKDEQKKLGELFGRLDNLITLHQRKREITNLRSPLTSSRDQYPGFPTPV